MSERAVAGNRLDESERFPALVAREVGGERFELSVEERRIGDLPAGDLLVQVDFSSLNYKDALSASGNRGVTKRYPHTPGIDAAGRVVHSSSPGLSPGDEVLVTGFDLGMGTSGGWGRYIRVPAAWALPLPRGLSAREAMEIGTAGFTAALAVSRLWDALGGSVPSSSPAGPGGPPPSESPSHASQPSSTLPAPLPIVVSGASGGVGSFAVALLGALGYEVVAVSGKPEAAAYLRELGATSVIGRTEATDGSGRPLLSARWIGGVDTVGGAILSTMLRATAPFGAVAACGNAMEARFEASVYPFILRGVNLIGIDAASYPLERRLPIWELLAADWRPAWRRVRIVECALSELPDQVERMREGRLLGRVIVNLST